MTIYLNGVGSFGVNQIFILIYHISSITLDIRIYNTYNRYIDKLGERVSKPMMYPANVNYENGMKDAVNAITEKLAEQRKQTGLGFIQYDTITFILKEYLDISTKK